MPCFTTVLATAVATISLGFVAAVPANADPTPVPTPPVLTSTVQPMSLGGGTKVKVTINAGQAEFVRTASKLLRNGRNGTHLDWRKAKSYWGKHTSTRDQFASGWVKVGAS